MYCDLCKVAVSMLGFLLLCYHVVQCTHTSYMLLISIGTLCLNKWVFSYELMSSTMHVNYMCPWSMLCVLQLGWLERYTSMDKGMGPVHALHMCPK